jgi:TonB family protein
VYPKGVNIEAQIRLEAQVMPDGRIRAVRPVQKGNTALEEAAIAKVRHWIFEPLALSIPQRDQNCVITFNFVLQ